MNTTDARPAAPPVTGATDLNDLTQLRGEALQLYALQFPHPLTRTTMTSALRRLARTFSDGQCDEHPSPWELLLDVADVLDIRNSALDVYQRATVSRDESALRTMLRCCWKVGLLDYDQYKARRRPAPAAQGRRGTDRTPAQPGGARSTA